MRVEPARGQIGRQAASNRRGAARARGGGAGGEVHGCAAVEVREKEK